MTFKTVTIEECRRLLDQGQPLHLLDVRTPPEFEGLHATGAQLMPLDRLAPAALAHQPTAAAPLYVLCRSGSRSRTACHRLQSAGVEHVVNVEGGTLAWEQAGLPVIRGRSKVISLERQVRIGAGVIVLIGTILAAAVHPGFLVIPGFVGAGLTFAGITDICGMGMLLAKMPWNRGSAQTCAAPPAPNKSMSMT